MIPEPMPLFILTGFLGSGKTTLLQRILRAPNSNGIGVLINEFGEANLDHSIISHAAEAKAVIQSGCICCSTRSELERGLLDFLRRSLAGEVQKFEKLVIETSGLSDPASIINTVQTHRVLREYFRVAGVLTTVDAVNGARSLEQHVEVAKQISVADMLLITKSDLASPERAAALKLQLASINPIAKIVDARTSGLDFSNLLPAGRIAAFKDTAGTVTSAHNASTFTLTFSQPLDWAAFVIWLSMLLKAHGERVLRIKGIINTGGNERPVVIHGVQHIMHAPEHMPSWPQGGRTSTIVFIVRGIDKKRIQDSLDRFLEFAAPTRQAKL
jgi:G3E family GTPase